MCRTALLATLFLAHGLSAQGPPVIVHARALGGNYSDFIRDMAPADGNRAMLVGMTTSNDGDVSGYHGSNDGWVVRVDTTGTPDWQRCLGGVGSDILSSIVNRPGGGHIMSGQTTSSNNGDVGTNHAMGTSDAWIVALDAGGTILWQQLIGGTLNEDATMIHATSDGGTIFTGTATSIDGDLVQNNGGSDLLVAKLDANGGLQWAKTYGGSSDDGGFKVIELAGGGYVVLGQTRSPDGDVVGHHGNVDTWVIGLDGSGQLLWQRAWGGAEFDLPQDLLPDASGGFVISVYTNSVDGDISSPMGQYDSYLVGFDDSGNVLWDRLFGSPANDTYGKMLRTSDGGLLLFGGYWACEVTQLDPAYDAGWVFDDDGLTHAQPTAGFLTPDGVWLCGTILSGPSSIPNFHGPGDGYVMKLTHNYDLVRGQAFVDLDGDGAMGASENPLVHHLFRIAGTDRMDLSGSSGSFELSVLQPGGCLTEPSPLAHFTAVPSSHSSFFTAFGEVDSSAVFAMQPNGTVNDLRVELIPVGPFRPGFWSQYAVHCMNTGTTTMQATLVLHPDQHLDFVGSNPAPDVVTDSLVWDLGSMAPLEQRMFWVTFEVATTAPVGSQALSDLIAYPIAGDALPTDNHATGPVMYTSSCDPNIVRVDRAVVGPGEIGGPLELEYTIEFQNTGNDTAFTVLIENPWPTNCRISSFYFVATSHPVSITMDADEHRTWFRFDHILLPDSTTDEAASHGFVRYRIKPDDDLVLGDTMTNQSGIFFDYNAVVMTNTATTLVGTNTGVPASALPPCSVHPNPTTGHVTVSVWQRDAEALVRVLDALGRPVLHAPMPDLQLDLDLSKLSPGSYHVIRTTGRGQTSTHVILQ